MIPVRSEILWDINLQTIDPDKNKAIIIEKVLSYGNIEELKFIFIYYGIAIIRQTVKNIGYLDPKTFEFVVNYLKINKEEMKCYIKKQSTTGHWS